MDRWFVGGSVAVVLCWCGGFVLVFVVGWCFVVLWWLLGCVV